MKANYIKHQDQFTELQHLVDFVKKQNIKDYYYNFSFTYGYTLYYVPKLYQLQLIEELLNDVYNDKQITLTEEQTIAIEWLYDKYNELTN